MLKRLNLRLLFLALVLISSAALLISREHRPSFLRPGLRLHAYVSSSTAGTVTVVDLVSLSPISTVPVGPSPSGLRAHPTRNEVWGVSTSDGFVWILDTVSLQVVARIPVGSSPFALDFSPDGSRAFVAASGSNQLLAIDCRSRQIIARARTGRRPWLARLTPDARLVLVPLRDDSALTLFDAFTLAPLATIPVASRPEQVVVLPDSSVAFVSSAGSSQVSAVDLRRRVLLAALPLSGPSADLILKPDGGELYVTSPASHTLEILNTWTTENVQSLLLGLTPTRGTLTSDSRFLYVSDSAAGRVLPIEINSRLVLRPIPVGARPGVLRTTPGDDLLLVINEDSSDLAVIRTRPPGSLLTLIPVGPRPNDLALKLF